MTLGGRLCLIYNLRVVRCGELMPRCENNVYVSCNVTCLWHISYVRTTLHPCTIPLNICVSIVVVTKWIRWKAIVKHFNMCLSLAITYALLLIFKDVGLGQVVCFVFKVDLWFTMQALDFDCNHEVIAKKNIGTTYSVRSRGWAL